jgi:hypothetical protein
LVEAEDRILALRSRVVTGHDGRSGRRTSLAIEKWRFPSRCAG